MSDVHKRIQTVCKEYETSLEDLTFNSRVLIQSLTLLADKSKVYAPSIVQIVEKRINKVPPEQKLPVLYLLDSIMKNLGGEYLQLFSKNIVATFCHTFEKVVDPKKRISLFKLRQTWNAIIPVQKLIAIDKHVHSIDSGWPVMPEPPSTPQSPTIFVNPKFIKPNGELSTLKLESNEEEKDAESVREQTKDHETKQGSTTNIQEQRKALLEQQRQKRFEREKQMGLHTGEANISSSDTPLKSAIGGSKNTKVRPKRVRFIDEEQTDPVVKKVKDENNLEISTSQGQHSIATVESASDKQQTVTEETRSDEPVASNILEQVAKEPVNMSDLLSKLVKTGLLPQQQPMKLLPQQQPTELLPQQQPTVLLPQQHSTGLLPQQQPMGSVEATQGTSAPPTNTTQQVNSMDEHLPPAIRMNPTLRIPDLHLKIPHLKQFYPSLVDLLYAGEQCSQCGLRFTEVASSEYRNHLDWHFQLNRKDKDGLRKTSRNWFLHPDDWYALKEGEQIEDKVKSNIFEQEQLEEEQKDEDGNISCKVLPGEGIEVCHLCGETFEQFWEEDLEEWHFKDAVRTPDGILYHGDCRKEAKDSEVPMTPVTPVTSGNLPQEEFEKARTKASTDVDR